MNMKVKYANRASRAHHAAMVLFVIVITGFLGPVSVAADSYAVLPDEFGDVVITYSPDTIDYATKTMDILVEIDYMVLRDGVGNVVHSHMPQPIEVQAIVQMFACAGNTLLILVSDEVPEIPVMLRDPDDANSFFDYDGVNSFGWIKDNYMTQFPILWHYCVFGHRYQDEHYAISGSSGLSELGGDDFVVTLGGWDPLPDSIGTPFDRAASLAHELGHNLTLTHCGPNDCESVGDHIINIPSTMSYNYQLHGIRSQLACQGLANEYLAQFFREIDYSRGHTCALDENNLTEIGGMGFIEVDWDCDGVIEGGTVAHDLDVGAGSDNSWCTAAGLTQVLLTFNEWAHIEDKTKTHTPEELVNLPNEVGISWEEVREMRADKAFCPQPVLTVEPCRGEHYINYVRPYNLESGTGTCEFPFNSLLYAYNNSYDQSLLLLLPGVYAEGSPGLTFNRPMTLTSVGSMQVTIMPAIKRKSTSDSTSVIDDDGQQ